MFPKNTPDVEYPTVEKHNGTRDDGRNLVQEWIDKTKNNVKRKQKPVPNEGNKSE